MKDYTYFAGGKHHAPKYNENPILKRINNGFMESLSELVKKTGAKKIFEVGCGEGQLLGVLHDQGYNVRGCDCDVESVQMTNDNFENSGRGGGIASFGNLYDLTPIDDRLAGRTIICCEVLEHVEDPEEGIKILVQCTDDYLIFSVPHEPLWRLLNVARGKYWKSLGNTPGHINHWTSHRFKEMVSKFAEVIEVRKPLPWTMILARKR